MKKVILSGSVKNQTQMDIDLLFHLDQRRGSHFTPLAMICDNDKAGCEKQFSLREPPATFHPLHTSHPTHSLPLTTTAPSKIFLYISRASRYRVNSYIFPAPSAPIHCMSRVPICCR